VELFVVLAFVGVLVARRLPAVLTSSIASWRRVRGEIWIPAVGYATFGNGCPTRDSQFPDFHAHGKGWRGARRLLSGANYFPSFRKG
jgi:hypothetical protein